ncbi:hypothetical protein METBIDRAFT_10208 [Metschnikowia bicuspidata var. bicuspidata NRRL YB-4993]|uniref:Uncharacterized protein n=1 Tax=Metschnikowia bicuspidata var. bicuspidata NRRL YB-4993 TaxID=869754 RepID=A0A1A0HJ24_9ASCO|nr:hypothetical protein METBIDRAFT_10208 [Metschnikowia bicuspidata var. bicuspidata NRRL YB-4993]OBA24015.1 hypothetical protein METBIDRAFT_10208 [Metschnikowia bicuspidata var. bicuspidata NRRL YB-4993]
MPAEPENLLVIPNSTSSSLETLDSGEPYDTPLSQPRLGTLFGSIYLHEDISLYELMETLLDSEDIELFENSIRRQLSVFSGALDLLDTQSLGSAYASDEVSEASDTSHISELSNVSDVSSQSEVSQTSDIFETTENPDDYTDSDISDDTGNLYDIDIPYDSDSSILSDFSDDIFNGSLLPSLFGVFHSLFSRNPTAFYPYTELGRSLYESQDDAEIRNELDTHSEIETRIEDEIRNGIDPRDIASVNKIVRLSNEFEIIEDIGQSDTDDDMADLSSVEAEKDTECIFSEGTAVSLGGDIPSESQRCHLHDTTHITPSVRTYADVSRSYSATSQNKHKMSSSHADSESWQSRKRKQTQSPPL